LPRDLSLRAPLLMREFPSRRAKTALSAPGFSPFFSQIPFLKFFPFLPPPRCFEAGNPRFQRSIPDTGYPALSRLLMPILMPDLPSRDPPSFFFSRPLPLSGPRFCLGKPGITVHLPPGKNAIDRAVLLSAPAPSNPLEHKAAPVEVPPSFPFRCSYSTPLLKFWNLPDRPFSCLARDFAPDSPDFILFPLVITALRFHPLPQLRLFCQVLLPTAPSLKGAMNANRDGHRRSRTAPPSNPSALAP